METQNRIGRWTSCFLGAITMAVAINTATDVEAAQSDDLLWVLVGTYTGGESKGVYVLQFDVKSGELSQHGVIESDNPSFLAVHPDQKHVYAVNEVGNFGGRKAGAVSAFAFDAKIGTLKFLNQQSSGGSSPCHLIVDRTGRAVLAANYGGGSVCALPIDSDGRLGAATSFIQHTGSSVNKRRQAAPHAHSINLDPSNRFAVAADLGIDKMLIYRFNGKSATLIDSAAGFAGVTPGAGPRHFSFHPDGRFGYVINEMNLTVTAFSFDGDSGSLNAIQTISTLPPNAEKQGSTAEVRVHPSGRFLYGSNRGHDSIVAYSIDQETGKLTYVENEPTGGKTPRNFYIEPSGRWLFAENQSTDNIVVFRINPETGELLKTGSSISVPSPVCIRTIPVSK